MLRSLKLNKNLVIIAASYAIGLTIILALIGYAGVSNVIENIMRKMTYQLFAITFILDITGLIFYALIWHILLLGTGSKVKFKVSLSSTWASIFIMYLSPTGIIVELLKIILTNKEGKVNIGKGMAAFMMQRIIYSISFITIAIVSYLIAQYRYVIIGEMIGRIISALIMIAIATIITLIIIGIKAEKIEEIILRIYEKYQDNINKILSKYDSMEIVNSISSTINEFKNSFQELKNNKTHLITVFILTTANWVLNVTILYVVLLSL
ncbi:MAG: lysylphosphatidylglycerol synthase transmembrane domain-containing protein, partial [Candidatus Methanomethylicia archaeon]